ncbi:angiopoietin-related protein 7-like [Amphiura filiformis]|uniref:angiopoietin-related protein 7-like n=1 Tax=Amphiura filiformis TaxID=82378 RepID=UPI003B21D54F
MVRNRDLTNQTCGTNELAEMQNRATTEKSDTLAESFKTLTQMSKNQVKMAETQSQTLNKLSEIGEKQSQMERNQIQMSETQSQMAQTQSQMAQTQNQMAEMQRQTVIKLSEIGETQSLMANTFNQVVTLLQMQSHQLHNISASMNTMVSVLENISHSLDQQTDQIELLNQRLPVPVNNSGIIVEDQLLNSTAPKNTMRDILGTQAAETQSQQQVNVASTMVTQLVTQQDHPRDCADLATRGNYPSGSYTIKPSESLDVDVYCDMDTDGGGWTVFQRRFEGSVSFYRGWDDYENGFGNVDGEHWAGLRLLHVLTSSRNAPRLRIELEAFDGDKAYAEYESFTVGDSSSNYVLTIGSYSGNAGDSLGWHNNMQFTTYDRDNDGHTSIQCAEFRKGAWWYNACAYSNLNGQYLGPTANNNKLGMTWRNWKSLQSLKTSRMMLRHTP